MPKASCRHQGKNKFLGSDLITPGQILLMVVEKLSQAIFRLFDLEQFKDFYSCLRSFYSPNFPESFLNSTLDYFTSSDLIMAKQKSMKPVPLYLQKATRRSFKSWNIDSFY